MEVAALSISVWCFSMYSKTLEFSMEVAALSVSVWCVYMYKYNTGILYIVCLHVQLNTGIIPMKVTRLSVSVWFVWMYNKRLELSQWKLHDSVCLCAVSQCTINV